MTSNGNKELAAMLHCDDCGEDFKMIDCGNGFGKYCPFCKSTKKYDFDDVYMIPVEKRRKI